METCIKYRIGARALPGQHSMPLKMAPVIVSCKCFSESQHVQPDGGASLEEHRSGSPMADEVPQQSSSTMADEVPQMTVEKADDRLKTYEEFWPFYLKEHSKASTRRLHYVGSSLALLAVGSAAVTRRPGLLLAVPFAGAALCHPCYYVPLQAISCTPSISGCA